MIRSPPRCRWCPHRHQTPVTRYVAKEQWSKAIALLKERLRAVKPGFVPRSYGREAGYSYFKRLCAAVAGARPASRRQEKIDGPGPDKDGMQRGGRRAREAIEPNVRTTLLRDLSPSYLSGWRGQGGPHTNQGEGGLVAEEALKRQARIARFGIVDGAVEPASSRCKTAGTYSTHAGAGDHTDKEEKGVVPQDMGARKPGLDNNIYGPGGAGGQICVRCGTNPCSCGQAEDKVSLKRGQLMRKMLEAQLLDCRVATLWDEYQEAVSARDAAELATSQLAPEALPWKDDVPTIGILAAMVEEEDTMVVLSTAADMGGDMRELMEGKMPEGVKGHLVSPCLEADQYVGAVAGEDGALEPDDLVPPKAFWDQMPKIEGVHAAFRARVMGKSTRVGMDTAAQFCLVKRSALSNSSYANRRRTRVRLLGVGGDLKISEIAAVRVQLGSDKNARGIWVWALIVPEVAIPFPDIDMVLDFTTLTVVADRIETPEPGDYSIQIRADDVVQHMIELAAKPEIKTATSTRVCRPFHLGPDLQGVHGRGHIPAAANGAAGEGSSL